jgi:hypothetical protein
MKNIRSPRPSVINVARTIQQVVPLKTTVFEDFQRRPCWSRQNQLNYIESTSSGTAIMPLVLCDIESGLAATPPTSDGFRKYKEQKSIGNKYAVIDGQNRLATLRDFTEGDIAFAGSLWDLDDVEHRFSKSDPKRFHELGASIQQHFLKVILQTAVIEDLPYGEQWRHFLSVNEGVDMSEACKRNALPTPIAEMLRKEAASLGELFGRGTTNSEFALLGAHSATQVGAMKDVETLTDVFMDLTGEKAKQNHASRKEFFEDGLNRLFQNVPRYHTTWSHFQQVMAVVAKVVDDVTVSKKTNKRVKSAVVPLRTFWALVYAVDYMLSQGHSLRPGHETDFYEYVKETCDRLADQAEQRQQLAAKKLRLAKPHLSPDEIATQVGLQYYHVWRARTDDPNGRLGRKRELTADLRVSMGGKGCFRLSTPPAALSSAVPPPTAAV